MHRSYKTTFVAIVAAAMAANGYSEQIWRAAGGNAGVELYDSILAGYGVSITGAQQTGADVKHMRENFHFGLRDTGINVRTKAKQFQAFQDGALEAIGGFDLRIDGRTYSLKNFTIEAKGPGLRDGFIIRDGSGTKNGLVLHLDAAKFGGNPYKASYALVVGDLTLDAQFANKIRRPDLAGLLIGTMGAEGRFEFVSGPKDDGEWPTLPTEFGSDMLVADGKLNRVWQLSSLGRTGTYPNGQTGFATATESCNVGTSSSTHIPLHWFAAMDVRHPVIGTNIFRYYEGRMEQVGIGWLKHGFFALASNACGSCQGNAGGTLLGLACSDIYGTGNNGDRSWLGPRSEVNPFTGVWNCSNSYFSDPNNTISTPDCADRRGSMPAFNGVDHRVVALDQDLIPTSGVSGAIAYESFYLFTEAGGNSKDVNMYNNWGYQKATLTWNGSSWGRADVGGFVQGPVLNSWGTHRSVAQPESDGDVLIASSVTSLGGGLWRYEYGVYPMDYDREVRSVSFPIRDDLNVTNISCGTVFQNSKVGANYVMGLTGWSQNRANGKLEFSTQTQAQNPNAPSMKYGQLYNFGFTCNAAPITSNALLGIFKPGTLMVLNSNNGTTNVIQGPPYLQSAATSLTLINGQNAGGDVNSIQQDDGNEFVIFNDVFNSNGEFEISGVSAFGAPASYGLEMRAYGDRSDVNAIVKGYNYTNSTFETVGTTPMPTVETTVSQTTTANPGRFIGLNNAVRARVSLIPQADYDLSDGWFNFFDTVGFKISL